jgi:hypothetical protein
MTARGYCRLMATTVIVFIFSFYRGAPLAAAPLRNERRSILGLLMTLLLWIG